MSKGARFLTFLAVILVGWWIGNQFDYDLAAFRAFLQGFPLVLSGLIFVGLYVLTSSIAWFGPKDFFRITGAVFFGGWVSAVFIWTAEMINSYIMFSLSRSLGRDFVQERLKISSKKLDQAHEKIDILWVFALRTNPLIPFRFLDLAYGLTRLDYKKYFLTIWHISFVRILWIQCAVALIGDILIDELFPRLNDKSAHIMEVAAEVHSTVLQPLMEHPYLMKASGLYLILILGATLVAWILGKLQKGKEPKNV